VGDGVDVSATALRSLPSGAAAAAVAMRRVVVADLWCFGLGTMLLARWRLAKACPGKKKPTPRLKVVAVSSKFMHRHFLFSPRFPIHSLFLCVSVVVVGDARAVFDCSFFLRARGA